MAVIYPKADYQPLGAQTEPLMTSHDIVCLHTMVGSLQSTDNYFEQDGYGGVESHFGIGYDGETVQWQDLSRQADANLEGNPRLLSIETADSGTGFPIWSGENVPAWTEAQLDAISELVAWLCRLYDIPAQLVSDSKPGRRGIGYHRQGINPWRVTGGEVWSESNGKVCPGDRRVAQISSQVIPRVNVILEGMPIPPMPTADEISKDVWSETLPDDGGAGANPPFSLAGPNGMGRHTGMLLRKIRGDLHKVLDAVTNSTPGTGATAAEVRQIVQEELAKLKLTYTP